MIRSALCKKSLSKNVGAVAFGALMILARPPMLSARTTKQAFSHGAPQLPSPAPQSAPRHMPFAKVLAVVKTQVDADVARQLQSQKIAALSVLSGVDASASAKNEFASRMALSKVVSGLGNSDDPQVRAKAGEIIKVLKVTGVSVLYCKDDNGNHKVNLH